MSGKKVKNKLKDKNSRCEASIHDYQQKAKDGNISINDLANMLILSHDKLKHELKHKVSHMEQKIDNVKEMADKVEGAVTDQEKRIRQLEVKALAKNIIMKKVELHANAIKGIEDQKMTQEQVKNKLKTIGMDHLTLKSCKRFKPDHSQKGPPFIQVTLGNIKEKRQLHKKLREKRPDFSIDEEYPKSMKKEMQMTRTVAQKIRQDSGFTTKVKIIVIEGMPVIMQKTKNDNVYSPTTTHHG